jgi:cytochrome c oxidase cbb3-type subunit III
MNRIVLLILVAACNRAGHDNAPNAAPPVTTPVGPLPGPGVEPAVAKNPYGDDAVVIREGRRLFLRFNCAGCHGDHGGGGMGPSLRDPDWIYGDSDAHIFDSIAEGRAHGMPAWGIKLPEDQVWKLVSYIQALRTDKEVDRP